MAADVLVPPHALDVDPPRGPCRCRRCCGPADEHRTFGPCSALALLRDHPGLLGCHVLRHPCKTLLLLRGAEVVPLRRLLGEVPPETARALMPELLDGVQRRDFLEVVIPLLNAGGDVGTGMASLLQLLEPRHMVLLASSVPASKLAAVLAAPAVKLTALVAAVDPDRFDAALVPVLLEPDALISGTLVPLLRAVERPDHLGLMINCAPPRVLLWVLRGVPAPQLALLIGALEPADLVPDGTIARLLQEAADDPDLVDRAMLPLLRQGDPAKIAPLLRGVPASTLLLLLRRVECSGMLQLLDSMHPGVAVRLLSSGPHEQAVAKVASLLATAMRIPLASEVARRSTDALGLGLAAAETAMERLRPERA